MTPPRTEQQAYEGTLAYQLEQARAAFRQLGRALRDALTPRRK